jgi:Transposase DDE domain group 1
VISRLVTALAADAPRGVKAIRAARAAARERAWALAGPAAPGSNGGLVTVDIDATIVIAHSAKERAAPTWKHTYGFHPLAVFADHGAAGTGESLATTLRPGNAGQHRRRPHRGDAAGPGPAARPDQAPGPGPRGLRRRDA